MTFHAILNSRKKSIVHITDIKWNIQLASMVLYCHYSLFVESFVDISEKKIGEAGVS